jgi:alkylation response protein AidB-like acyl-CoA dehydrogenase
MDFGLNEGQEMLRKTARDFLAAECPKSFVRQMAKDEKGYSPELWHKMAELGWLGLAFPEQYGGTGGSFLDLTVLLEEMGRACLPGPFFPTVVLGGMTILLAGDEKQKQELVPKIAEGTVLLTVAINEPNGGYNLGTIATRAVMDGDHFIITGTKLFVPDAHIADHIICLCKEKDGAALFLVNAHSRGVAITPLETIAGDKQCEVVLDQVAVPVGAVLGDTGHGQVHLQTVLGGAAVAKCAEMVGGAQQVLEMTVSYVKDRKQFGVPVGAFQAFQHHCANMMTYVDTSRFLTYKAAWMVSEGLACDKEIAMAKAWVSDAYRKVTLLGHQCIGGVGFMEDHDLPLYSKRAKACEVAFGDTDFHRELVAQELGL